MLPSSVQTFLFGGLAGVTFLANLVQCWVMFRKRSMLKKTYNVIILNLAVTDVLQGILLFVTPGSSIFHPNSYPRMSGVGGEFFCRVVFSTYLLYVCGKAANASIMCLSVERWYAVVRPTKYKCRFGRRRLYTYIILIWTSAAITEIFELFIAKLVDGSCQWITPLYGQQAENAFGALHVTVTFYIPSIVTWVSFIHIWLRFLSNPSPGHTRENPSYKKSVVRMCAFAAFFLTICWFPSETFWLLRKFNVLSLSYDFYLGFNLLAFFSACVNPFIYCLNNKGYRREFVKFFKQLCCLSRVSRVVPRIALPESSTQNEDHQMQDLRLQVHAACNTHATTSMHLRDVIDIHSHATSAVIRASMPQTPDCIALTMLPSCTDHAHIATDIQTIHVQSGTDMHSQTCL